MSGQQPPANWYPDPDDPNGLRYWDGVQWTEHRAPAASQAPGQGFPEPPDESRTGVLGSKKAMEAELENLRTITTSPAEVALRAAEGSLLEFVEQPEADEWHQSENARRQIKAADISADASAPAPL